VPQKAYHWLYSAVLGYGHMSGKVNTKIVEFSGEHSVLYSRKHHGYTKKGKIDLVCEKVGKELYESNRTM
jgi:hypothetical protein